MSKRADRRWRTQSYVRRQLRVAEWWSRFTWLSNESRGGLFSSEAVVSKATDGQGNLVLPVTLSDELWYKRNRGMCKKKAFFDCGRTHCSTCHFEKNDGGKRHKTHRERISHLSYCEQMEESGLGHLAGHDGRYNPRSCAWWEQIGLTKKDHKKRAVILNS